MQEAVVAMKWLAKELMRRELQYIYQEGTHSEMDTVCPLDGVGASIGLMRLQSALSRDVQ